MTHLELIFNLMKNILNLPIKLYNQLQVKALNAGVASQDYLKSLLAQEALRIKLEQAYKQEQEEMGLDCEDQWLLED